MRKVSLEQREVAWTSLPECSRLLLLKVLLKIVGGDVDKVGVNVLCRKKVGKEWRGCS